MSWIAKHDRATTPGCMSVLCLALAICDPRSLARAEPVEYCVTCTGPPALYRCTFSASDAENVQPGLQLFCISTLAREGRHQSCSVARASQTPCAGVLKVLALPSLPEATPAAQEPSLPVGEAAPTLQGRVPVEPPSDDVEAKITNRPPPSAAQPTPAQSAPPHANSAPVTPAEGSPQQPNSIETADSPSADKPLEKAGKAVGEAAKSTGAAIEKAGSAVGAAAKKGWDCLKSLFGDC